MSKKLYPILIIFIFFFIGFSPVKAVTCSNINKEINNYNAIEKSLSSLDCSQDTKKKVVNKCNKLNLKKSNSITTLYKMKQQNPNCKKAITKIDKIIKNNAGNCTKISDGLLESFTNKFLIVFYIMGPILTILFGSLDYTKAVMSSDSEALRKSSKNFVRRVIALILLVTMPILVNIILNLNNSNYLLNGEGYSCKSDYIILKENYTITYLPKEKSNASTEDISGSSGGSSSSSAGSSGNYLSWKQCNSSWSKLTLGTSSSNVCSIGCLTTSVAIQIANSKTAPASFDPGVLVKTLNSHGGYAGGGNFTWTGWQSIAPNFTLYNSSASVSGTKAQKAQQLANYIKKKYYPVIEVKKCIGRQHWVAVISVSGTKVTMADPASSSTDLSHYTCFSSSGSQRVALFKKK